VASTTLSAMEVALLELEQLLDEETAALRTLDRESIDRITFAKTEVCQRLTALTRDGNHSPERKAHLERIRHRALYNQVLLVHARDSVRGVLALIVGQSPHSSRTVPGDGRMLHVRG